MTEWVCPCCGHTATGKRNPKELIRYVHFSYREQAVVDLLISRFGRPVPRMEIVDAVYADREDGGPEGAANVVAATIHRIRHSGKLEQIGMTMERGKATHGTAITWLKNDDGK